MSKSRLPEKFGRQYKWISVGIEFCAVIAIFTYIGYKLDHRLHTSPWLMLLFFFMGFAGMFYLLVKEAGKMNSD